MRPLGQRDGGAGFLVGGEVRQVVVHGEPLVTGAGADAAGEIFIALGGVAPDAAKHPEQTLVAGLRGHVGDTGHQVSRADGVALDVLVVVDGHIVLEVGAVILVQGRVMLGGEELPAAVLDEEAGEIEVALIAGSAPELDQGQLDLRVPGIAQAFGRRAKDRINVVGVASGDVEEVGLAGGLVMRDGGLEHVPGAIEFVAVAEVGPALARFLDGVVAVEVAVRLLRRRHDGDDVVQLLLQRRVGMGGKGIGRCFERFVEVGVHEDRPAEALGGAAGGEAHVLDVPRVLELLQAEGDAGEAVGLAPRRPEAILDGDILEGHGPELEQRLLRRRRRSPRQERGKDE